ncbi:hypothetical protein FGIG_03136 [Fasciola gigantica]|uniref:Uncharacterized protein n=1 Tax=Fasciola gigantica TaxID=46835 RepID=A0A504Z2S0_FASGI|nr:hypothetical protein FGIG_03136 [Fasciola gigantica]
MREKLTWILQCLLCRHSVCSIVTIFLLLFSETPKHRGRVHGANQKTTNEVINFERADDSEELITKGSAKNVLYTITEGSEEMNQQLQALEYRTCIGPSEYVFP